MKHSDVQELFERQLISTEQRDRIVEAYHLRARSNSFMVVISWFGGILVAAGIVLLISANWQEIPRLLKVLGGVSLLVGAHSVALWIGRRKPQYANTAEALHFAGSLLFLGNIALIGQTYHLSARPGNAFAVWLLGIAALPWVLRSRAQWLLLLIGVGVWFGVELNDRNSPLYPGLGLHQVILYALLALCYRGFPAILERTSFNRFGDDADRIGAFAFFLLTFPLTWGVGGNMPLDHMRAALTLYSLLAAIASALFLASLRVERQLTAQWKKVWGAANIATVLLMGFLFMPGESSPDDVRKWVALLALSVLSILQIQVAIQRGSRFQLNLGTGMLATYIFTAYLLLVGSMARTGAMFVVSGLFLLALGVYLEKKRRVFLSNFTASGL